MIRLSVNINKIATLRNARGGNIPNVLQAAVNCEKYGAQGITVHPRPDERHIRYSDVRELRPFIKTEFNMEGYPSEQFMELAFEVLPHQVTLVPDPPEAITSNAGWDTIKNHQFLSDAVTAFKEIGIRTSIFISPDPDMVEGAALCGAQRVELYTEPYARLYPTNPQEAIAPYLLAARKAREMGIELNAGHDLDLNNLRFLAQNIPFISEVSIGHALISDALYLGLEATIHKYLGCLK
jgi:pyridoxine 5-phosphate synthase